VNIKGANEEDLILCQLPPEVVRPTRVRPPAEFVRGGSALLALTASAHLPARAGVLAGAAVIVVLQGRAYPRPDAIAPALIGTWGTRARATGADDVRAPVIRA
jgi:hypothetical protein